MGEWTYSDSEAHTCACHLLTDLQSTAEGHWRKCRVNFYISIANKAIGRITENGCRGSCNFFPIGVTVLDYKRGSSS